MPTSAHSSKLTKHRGECVLLQDDCFQISTFACMKPWKLLDSEFLVNAPWLKVAKEKCELPNGKVIDDFYTLWQPDWVLILARTKEGKWVMTEQYRHGTGKIALEFPAGIIDKGETPEEAAIRELQEECGYGVRLETRDERCETVSSSSCRGTADASSKVLIKKMTGSFVASPLRMTSKSDADALAGSLRPCSAQAATIAKNDNNGVMYVGNFPVNPDRHRGKFHVVFIDGVERLGKTHFDDTEEIETFLYTDEEFQAKIADGTFDHPLQIAGYYKWALTQR
jgi:8-oxo-dGTP pyrophosphatase MutT (NUDIX family)